MSRRMDSESGVGDVDGDTEVRAVHAVSTGAARASVILRSAATKDPSMPRRNGLTAPPRRTGVLRTLGVPRMTMGWITGAATPAGAFIPVSPLLLANGEI